MHNDRVRHTTDTGWVQLFSNNHAYAGLKADGTLATWGSDSYGGDMYKNGDPNPATPNMTGVVDVTTAHSTFVALREDGAHNRPSHNLASPNCASPTYYSPLTTHYLLLTTRYLPLTTYYLLLTTHYLLPTTHYLLLTTYYSLLTTYCLLPTVLLLTAYY